ncbi:MAG: N-acyl-L-amino acid amidohydrolase [Bacteroidetes bacterium GWF2_38_335]|nr:MAG: N-acyl-L-amino acid amidohydrolase [Bacteroidetes bacterium GWF2_38_335]OFY80124.1 MAG: N-acyl-L-amino acid amidohydrolase [Bacteroidetes bacterium RIFOXYA12_FULL_38_20]HBS88549.1 amidohydrolase [Bacteroidales bacterium]
MELLSKIKELSAAYYKETVKTRQYLHKNPELSFNEVGTSEFICDFLKNNKIPFQKGIAKTGILGIIEGKKPGKTIALRADMDALPVPEKNILPYTSKNKGVMHACGHDMHMASLMATAKILNSVKDSINGRILLVFQPAEEKLPGGAKAMLEDGLFKKYKPDHVIAQHVMPELEAGKTGFREGMYMASTDEIYMTVKGKGGHAAMPHQITDTVLVSSHIIVGLQQIVSRKGNVSVPSVLSFGKIIAQGATNIIPDEVKIEGTFRTMDETWRKSAHKEIVKLAKGIAASMGAECEIEIVKGYPFLVNDSKTTAMAEKAASEYSGKRNVTQLDIRMTAEDFSYFTQLYPSVMYRTGTGNVKKGIVAPLHSPSFNIDESVLKESPGIMAWIAISLLAE